MAISARAAIAKRALDLLIAGCGLLVLSPVLAVTATLIWSKLGAPVLFRQVRPGMNGDPFTLYKFRTMRNAVDATGRELSDGERLTSFGLALRASSLDELPELWNILRGDMSLVGPRPLLMQYLPLYSPRQARRHEVRPGLTGLAQISGRNALTWDEKFSLDVQYIDRYSFWLDLRIILLTFVKVLKREAVSADGFATMPAFKGKIAPHDRGAHQADTIRGDAS